MGDIMQVALERKEFTKFVAKFESIKRETKIMSSLREIGIILVGPTFWKGLFGILELPFSS